jgi:hypothetical protein
MFLSGKIEHRDNTIHSHKFLQVTDITSWYIYGKKENAMQPSVTHFAITESDTVCPLCLNHV